MIRTTSVTMTFKRAFRLPGEDEAWPAGDYVVTADEEQLDASFPAYHRIATRIELRRGAVTRYVTVAAEDLAQALAADGEGSTGLAE
jgi:hypothetical protein